jgi:Carbohydrate family 9 binding domain-like/Carbohydrate binding domain
MIKKIFIIVLAVIGSWEVATAKNLLFNGDFEKIDKKGNIVKWKNYYIKRSYPKPYADSFGKGKSCLHIIPDGKDIKGNKRGGFVCQKESPIVPGKTYTLSFFAKSPNKGQILKTYFYTYSATKPHYYKTKLFSLTKNWRKYTFNNTFPNAKEWKNRKVYIMFNLTEGEAFIDKAALNVETKDIPPYLKGSALIKKNNINMLENPGFELGWQGWYASSYRNRRNYYTGKDERKVTFDDKNYVHGGKSLKLSPFSNIISKRQRFIPGEKYTCSFYAKSGDNIGRKRLIVYVITPKWKREALELRKKGALTDKWKRYSFSFTAPDHGSSLLNSFYVRLDNYNCCVWLDSIKLEKGELSDYDFTPQIGFRVSGEYSILKLNAESKLNVFLQLNKKISGKLSLKLIASNIYGKNVWKRVIPLSGLKKGLTSLDVNIKNQEKGVIGVRAILLNTSGKEISKGFWRYWVIDNKKVVLNPLFGYENRVAVYPVWAVKKVEKIFSLMGAGFHRNFLWPEKYSPLNPTDPKVLKYLRNKHSMIIKSGRKVNMTTVGYLYKDSLLSHYNKKYGTEVCKLTPTEFNKELKKWTDGFAKIIQATSPVITHYEIQNEINLHRIKKFKNAPSDGHVIMNPKRYVQMLKKAREIIAKFSLQSKIGVNLCRIDMPYLRKLVNAGALKYIDFFSFHSYQGTPESPPVIKQIAELKKFLNHYRKNIPIFNSEQYFGVRSYLNVWSEYGKVYYSDNEDDFVGRIIQNYLHHAAAGVPFALFAFTDTAFMLGNSNSIYYYYTAGAYRNLSQLLTGVKDGENLNLNEALRSFIFEREDGKKIVSFNTKEYGKVGKVLRSKLWSEVLDINGNRIETKEIKLQYLTCYAVYPPGISKEKAIADLKNLNFLGLSSPFETKLLLAKDGNVKFTSVNITGKPQSEKLTFESLPEKWKPIAPILLKNITPKGKNEKFLGKLSDSRDWRKTYIIKYAEEYPDGFDRKIRKLPSLDINKVKNIVVDGKLDDWKKARWLKLDKRNLSKDFSRGKRPCKGDDDLSAELALGWDKENFYIVLKVNDNILNPISKHENYLFNKDSIQVYFDLKNDNAAPVFKAYDFNDVFYQIGFHKGVKQPLAFLEKNPAGRYIGAGNQTKGVDSDVKIAYKKTNNGYIYEMAFPEATLPFIKFMSGSEFALDILINDNDGKGRKQGLTFSSVGNEPHGSSFTWKAVRLY